MRHEATLQYLDTENMNTSIHKHQMLDTSEDIEISLTELISIIWQGRWTVAVITSMIVIITFAFVLITKQYESEGWYRFGGPIPLNSLAAPAPGISLADYKRFSASFQTTERFEQYINRLELENTSEISQIQRIFLSRSGISKQIEPVYSFTQADAKTLFSPKDGSNNILGLRIIMKGSKPEVAQKMVEIMGYYTMDSIIYDAYADSILVELDRNNTRTIEINNKIITKEEEQRQLQRMQTVLQNIIRKNPSVAESRLPQQVISVNEESVRYLAPTTQLIAVELKLSELDEVIRTLQREAKQIELKQDFYHKVQHLHNNFSSSESFLASLPLALNEVFQDKDLDDNEIKEIFNTLSLENQRAENLYLKRSRFVAGPTLPLHSTARLGLTVAGSALAGIFLSLIFVLGRHWWKENMRTSVSK